MILDVIEEYAGPAQVTSNGREWHFNCPLCRESRSRLFVNVITHKVWCHNCQFGGTVISLLAALRGITYKQALDIYKDSVNIIKMSASVKDEVLEKLVPYDYTQYLGKSVIPLPDEFVLLDQSNSVFGKRVRKYLHSRNITDRQITDYKFGYCYDGKYEKRAILPVYDNKDLRYWVARSVEKKPYKKELAPSNEDWQVGKSEVVFNLYKSAILYGTAILTEGIFDALSFGDMGCALLGHYLTEEQEALILKFKNYLENGVYIAMDEDAWKDSLAMADRLYKHLPVFICDIKGDPNEIGMRGCLQALSEATEYTQLSRVRLKLTK